MRRNIFIERSNMYNFNEKPKEYSAKRGTEIPVWVSPKYEQSKKKAIEIIEKYENIKEGDFWILMNETKTGKMAYTGLIISHNACLKINDAMPEESKFVPSCVSIDKVGYSDSLVYTYCNEQQGIYEVGEVSNNNCRNAYPYAMAIKRCFDRVVLKLCKLAYDGVYSDSEADEFKEIERVREKQSFEVKDLSLSREEMIDSVVAVCDAKQIKITDICKQVHVKSLEELTDDRLTKALDYVQNL